MIYYIHEKTILAFIEEVNDAIKKGHRVVALGMTEGLNSYKAKIDTEPPKGPKWHFQK